MQVFIALPITDPQVLELKQKYQPQASTEPHITLLPPGRLLVSVSEVLKAFNAIKVSSFKLRAKGIKKFNRGGVIALEFKPLPTLKSYYTALETRFEKKIIDSEGSWLEFVPHVTIARPRKNEQKRKILEGLNQEKLSFEIVIDKAALFRREKEGDAWQLLETVHFL